MVFALVFIFFVAAIAIDILVIERLANKKAAEMFQNRYMSGLVPEPESEQDLLFHEGHSWLRMDKALFAVGLDEFTRRLAGAMDRIETPTPGAHVEKGKPAWTLRIGERRLVMKAPISGRVYAVNEELVAHPDKMEGSAYKDNWILKIAPDHALRELPDLYTPHRFLKWFDVQKTRLFSAISPGIGPAMADGDELEEGAARSVDEETWRRINEIVYGINADVNRE